MEKVFSPKLFGLIKDGSVKKNLSKDILAGIVVGIVALPLAIAFAVASGVSPEKGIITAIVAGFLISFFGGSRVQIGGPTGAFIIIVYGIVNDYGLDGMIISTIFAGVIMIGFGMLRLGTLLKFIPHPLIVGFTSGIALTIFSTQISSALGLTLTDVPGSFIGKWGAYFGGIDTVNWYAVGITIVTVLIAVYMPKITSRVPGSFVAILVVTPIVAFLLPEGAVTTIGSEFGEIKCNLTPVFPSIEWGQLSHYLQPAMTIAILGAIESLLSAVVADGMISGHHRSNTELIAQGIANIASPLFGGIPATGAIARTMANINNGGKTPVAGMIHAMVLLLILLFLMPLAQYIPMACLAGVLVIVSYNMSGWRTFKALLKNPKSDVTVLLITFFLTVIFDLTIAIEVGLVIACVLFMHRVMETTEISVIKDEINLNEESASKEEEENLSIPKGVEVYEINGPYFFGIATKFEEIMSRLGDRPKVRIIRMRKVPFIDSTGIHNLTNLCQMAQREKTTIVLSGVNEKVHKALEKSGFYELLGEKNICPNINVALERSKELLNE